MKVVFYPAISLDGFIAKTNGDSDWVSEEAENNSQNIKYIDGEIKSILKQIESYGFTNAILSGGA